MTSSRKHPPPGKVCFILRYLWLPWTFLFFPPVEICLPATSTLPSRKDLVCWLFQGSLQTLLGWPSVLIQAGKNPCKDLNPCTFDTQWGEGPPSPPLAGGKPFLSSPSVTHRKVMAKIWISPNLIRALSESTGVGVRRELGVQRRGCNFPVPQHMAVVLLKAQDSIYFMQRHCPKRHTGHISNTWTLNPILQSSPSSSDFPPPTPQLPSSFSPLFFWRLPVLLESWGRMNGMFWFTTGPLNSIFPNQLISTHSDNQGVGARAEAGSGLVVRG